MLLAHVLQEPTCVSGETSVQAASNVNQQARMRNANGFSEQVQASTPGSTSGTSGCCELCNQKA